jgi:hypothetical protein
MKFSFPLRLLLLIVVLGTAAMEQSTNATISGIVLDPSGSAIPAATLQLVNDVTGLIYAGATNSEGIYALSNLPPGPYRIQVSKIGFKTLIKPDIVLSVQDAVALNFTLPVGALSETITVEGGASAVNTESAAVSTVVDRQFAEDLPMNGRSFQTLIELTPGVVPASSNIGDGGQFNVSGQRANANYWMVDGVSANVGIAAFGALGNGLSGSLGTFSALGGTNSLVSVDALQEFRIQTSTYAPEFGRTPGGQISILTRSGTNQLHGTIFDYLRNDAFDANNWFANRAGLPKAREKQNDFGGTVGGPLLRDRTFFFFSYEGLRLRLPQTLLTTVPDLAARQAAAPALRRFFDAYPLPNGPDDPASGMARFDASFSNPASLDAYSLRLDHRVNGRLSLFGRYDYSPSEANQRASGGSTALSVAFPTRIAVQTATAGAVWVISPKISNDIRLNYSRTNSFNAFELDSFGGAVPVTTPPFPDGFTLNNAQFFFDILSLKNGGYETGHTAENAQRQFNIVDNISLQRGGHAIKLGVDYRRLSPSYGPNLYSQAVFFGDVSSAENGNVLFGLFGSNLSATFLFRNLGIFAQDTWRMGSRTTLTYGLRWDVDFAPSSLSGPSLPAVTGFDLNDLSHLALTPAGTSSFKTRYGNIAPRFGLAYQLSQTPDHERVVRGGIGIFYDLATGETGNILAQSSYPFGAGQFASGGQFPFDAATAAPLPITASGLSAPGSSPLSVFDPRLALPYTMEWNFSFEQAFGKQQSLSLSYVGSAGRKLIQSAIVASPNPRFNSTFFVTNAATSDYGALQTQFQRQWRRNLQVLVSYTWSHSIDTASAGSNIVGSNLLVTKEFATSNRGSSDFDIRHALSAASTYDIPVPRVNPLMRVVLGGWSVQNIVQVHSAPPVNVFESDSAQLVRFSTQVRPDIVPGQPLILFASTYPGGRALNPAAFVSPPEDADGNPIRQGTLGRNALRGFGLTQWDFAIHRDFPIHDSLKLEFRAELFNVLNHPNFAPPQSGIGTADFGQSTQILAESLGGNVGAGGFNALYQLGGPRSVQLGLKLQF